MSLLTELHSTLLAYYQYGAPLGLVKLSEHPYRYECEPLQILICALLHASTHYVVIWARDACCRYTVFGIFFSVLGKVQRQRLKSGLSQVAS